MGETRLLMNCFSSSLSCVYTHTHMHMCRDSHWVSSSITLDFIFELGSLIEPGAHRLLPDWLASELPVFVSLSLGVTGTACHTWLFIKILGTQSQAFAASALLTEPSHLDSPREDSFNAV